jgi:integrase/recombinase XerD
MASVAIVFRKDKLNKKGEAPIHFRIIKDRKISYISSGKMLHKDFWDDTKNRVRRKFPNSLRMNNYLLSKYKEVNDSVLENETNYKSLTSKNIKEKIYGKMPTEFFAFAETALEKYLRENKIGTYDKSRSLLNKLKNYMNGSPLYLHDFNHNFLSKYESHLRTFHKNKTNTIHRDLKFFRKLFNDAYRQDLIEHNQNPFLKYQLKQEKTQRTYLTEEEFNLIENLEFNIDERINLHRNMFVFAAYAGGLRISDVLQLRWKNFDGQHIHFNI